MLACTDNVHAAERAPLSESSAAQFAAVCSFGGSIVRFDAQNHPVEFEHGERRRDDPRRAPVTDKQAAKAERLLRLRRRKRASAFRTRDQ